MVVGTPEEAVSMRVGRKVESHERALEDPFEISGPLQRYCEAALVGSGELYLHTDAANRLGE